MNFFTDLEKTIDNAGRTIASKASSLADSSPAAISWVTRSTCASDAACSVF